MTADERSGGLVLPAHAASSAQIAGEFGVDLRLGLTACQVTERLIEYGLNELPKAPAAPFWKRMVSQLRGVIVLILLVAVALSIPMVDWIEAGVILAIVLLSAMVGSLQEARAEKALESLQELAAPAARVLRDARTGEIASLRLPAQGC